MRYEEHPVGAALAARVECIWLAEDESPSAGPGERILPDGCLEWIFHLGAPYAVLDPGGAVPMRQPASFLVGGLTRPLALVPTGPVRTMGVRFRPGGARDLFPDSLDLLADGLAPIRDLWGAAGRSIEEEVGGAASDAARRAAIASFLAARVARAREAGPRVPAAVSLILARGGRTPVAEVARRVGWSPRQLEREFRSRVGLSPKALSRIARFQNVLRLSGRRPEPSWASLAARCGYADQAHLVREFRELSGVTPTSRAASDGELARHFVEPSRLETLLAPPPGDVAILQDSGLEPP